MCILTIYTLSNHTSSWYYLLAYKTIVCKPNDWTAEIVTLNYWCLFVAAKLKEGIVLPTMHHIHLVNPVLKIQQV